MSENANFQGTWKFGCGLNSWPILLPKCQKKRYELKYDIHKDFIEDNRFFTS